MENVKSNVYSYCTAKERTTISFPAKKILEQKLLVGKVLDFGCGFGSDVELLKQKNIDIVGYDPHYFKEYPTEKFDTILCFYVLNVLLPEEQADVIMNISSLLKPTGKAYFAVRRDIQYEGYRMHKLHQKQTYQCLVNLPFKSIFLNENCEIYTYQHYTTLHKRKDKISPFFATNESRDLVFESATAFSFYDKFPVNKGHVLVLPKRLVDNYFDLTFKEQSALWFMVNKVQQYLTELYKPEGFNVGINIGQTAGQTMSHVHIHVIPRYKSDVKNPKGGVRAVIPEKKEY